MKYIILDSLNTNQYKELINFAFEYSQHFSVCTFKRYHKKDLSNSYYAFFENLKQYIMDDYAFILPKHYERGQKFYIYELNTETQKYISKVPNIFSWCPPIYPEDLTFYTNKKPWLISITHEKMLVVDTADQKVLDFLSSQNIAMRKDVF